MRTGIGDSTAILALTAVWLLGSFCPELSATQRSGDVIWRYELASDSKGMGAVADLDGDGGLEVVFGTYFGDERLVALDAATGEVKWTHRSDGGPFDASVTVVDFGSDREWDVLAADSSSGELRCLSGRGIERWRIRLGNSTDSVPAVADLDGDGTPEIVVGTMWLGDGIGRVSAYHASTQGLLWQRSIPGCVQSEPCLVDLDSDELPDVIVTSWRGDRGVHALSGRTGEPLWTAITDGDEKSMGMYHGVSAANTQDGIRIVLGTYDTPQKGQALALDAGGRVVWKKDLGELCFMPTTVVDVHQDGNDEFLVGGRILRLLQAADGREIWRFDVGDTVDRGASLADVDGDGDLDFVVAAGKKLFAIDAATGTALFEFAVSGSDDFFEKISSGVLIDDFDRDGFLDAFLVVGRGFSGEGEFARENNRGTAMAVRLGKGTGPGWHTFRGNPRRDGRGESGWGAGRK